MKIHHEEKMVLPQHHQKVQYEDVMPPRQNEEVEHKIIEEKESGTINTWERSSFFQSCGM